MASSMLMEGSSPKTSSPTLAVIMASSMAGVGFVTVSERRSMGIVLFVLGTQFKAKQPHPRHRPYKQKGKPYGAPLQCPDIRLQAIVHRPQVISVGVIGLRP